MDGVAARFRRAKAEAMKVKVGLPRGSGTHGPSGLPVVTLGVIHEFGSSDGRIPERPFLRMTMRRKRREHYALIRDLAHTVTSGRSTPRIALSQLGAVAAANVQEQIADGTPPPNAPATIRRKGSSTPLVDTGALRQAITYQVFRSKGGR